MPLLSPVGDIIPFVNGQAIGPVTNAEGATDIGIFYSQGYDLYVITYFYINTDRHIF